MTIRAYRFFNLIPGEYGAPFALCDQHYEMKEVPSNCILEEMTYKATSPCEDCERENEQMNKDTLVDGLLEALKEISIKGIVGRDIYAVLEEMREIAHEAIRNHEM